MDLFGNIFTNPNETEEKPKKTSVTHIRPNSDQIVLDLIPFHSLWGHCLCNASLTMSSILEGQIPKIFKGVSCESVLELGAGAGLPSVIAALCGCSVVSTDYPDEPLITNIRKNIERNVEEPKLSNVRVVGYKWGEEVSHLLSLLQDIHDTKSQLGKKKKEENKKQTKIQKEKEKEKEKETQKGKETTVFQSYFQNNKSTKKFDLVLMSDIIFNHICHDQLIKTCKEVLRLDGCGQVLVTVTHHRPKLKEKDLEFFTKAKEEGFLVDYLYSENKGLMFPKDEGDKKERSLVHVYKMRLEEHLDVVNEKGEYQGEIVRRSIAHKVGKWHPVVDIWVCDLQNDKVLLQKRSETKKELPGMFDVSCSGHISAQENPNESALREIYEELGLTIEKDQLIPAFTHATAREFHNGSIDKEFAFVYLFASGQENTNSFQFIDGEVTMVKWIEIDQLIEKCQNNDKTISPILPEYLKKLKNSFENLKSKKK
ncbi:protein n-terminal and lysine n-methyltransferase efm7 [Anaeramoeba flamelloides]|uniref:Protein n-terminal and lysine n-methyltransferase efm7 n=1 Tax=Anaeramoeba flamelloides TaxID=1746091 RepID=A0ABQ8XRB1_9EUKA|nr:protein n-terminal and lysine n-methyltransferase efm7 [Anaeramoeba flamelloides]